MWYNSPLLDHPITTSWVEIALCTSSHLSKLLFAVSHTFMTFLISVYFKLLLHLAADLSCVWHLDQLISFWTCLCCPNIPLSVGVGSHTGYFPLLLTPSWLFITACLSAYFLFLTLSQYHQWCFNRAYESWTAFICNPSILSSEDWFKIFCGT